MVIDPTYFGYGVGLVMVGWLAGGAVGLIIKAFDVGPS